ncbi:MAG: histidine phosphatase family protein [Alphaproteobacteria bacterium]|nr:histidine phosphatase family protein [Alphaproteobacteria bacterium]
MLYIMRHGETDWNLADKLQGQEDIPLNDNGRHQAEEAAKIIAILRITRIISSDLSRTKETAEIIAKKLNLTVEYNPLLREWNFGTMNIAKQKDLNPATFKAQLFENQKSGAESIDGIFARVAAFFNKFDMNQNTLIVSHGGLMRAMMYYLETDGKTNADEFINFGFHKHIGNAQIFAFQNKKFEPVR